ncbi:hypothetical protein H9Q70_014479 [Fusarium xylarioides]|nr:hypothetical protein H9Q70_014479 [Fusarium xylarioides]
MGFLATTVALVAAQGGFIYGLDSGQAIGGLTTGYVADKLSRKYTILIASILTIIGAVLQCAAVNIGMMIAGRLVAGIGCGQILSVVSICLAEVSKSNQRGFLVGLQGMMITIGFGVANWIGYIGAFANEDGQYRYDEAGHVLARLHDNEDDETFVEQELLQIQTQIQLERDQGNLDWFIALRLMFSRKYVRRTLTASFIVTMSQLSGSSVIQNSQNVFYQTLGFTGRTSLLISGVYGMMGIIGKVIYLVFVADKMLRTRTLWTGSIVLCIMISICMDLSAEFGFSSNDNQAGARGAIASIFLYSMSYAIFFNAMIWVVPSELFPFFLRTKGMALAVATKAKVAIVLSQITPLAIDNVGWRLVKASKKSPLCSEMTFEAKVSHTADVY